jgi:hypothetical protein
MARETKLSSKRETIVSNSISPWLKRTTQEYYPHINNTALEAK